MMRFSPGNMLQQPIDRGEKTLILGLKPRCMCRVCTPTMRAAFLLRSRGRTVVSRSRMLGRAPPDLGTATENTIIVMT